MRGRTFVLLAFSVPVALGFIVSLLDSSSEPPEGQRTVWSPPAHDLPTRLAPDQGSRPVSRAAFDTFAQPIFAAGLATKIERSGDSLFVRLHPQHINATERELEMIADTIADGWRRVSGASACVTIFHPTRDERLARGCK